MTETTDRQDAVPAHIEALTSIVEHEAAAAVATDVTDGSADAAQPEAVVATAVLVAEEELVALPPAQPEADAPPEVEAYRTDEAPLLDSELEEGIANIFATLHSATEGEVEDIETDIDADDDLAAADTSTFRLLGELDRLWHRAA